MTLTDSVKASLATVTATAVAAAQQADAAVATAQQAATAAQANAKAATDKSAALTTQVLSLTGQVNALRAQLAAATHQYPVPPVIVVGDTFVPPGPLAPWLATNVKNDGMTIKLTPGGIFPTGGGAIRQNNIKLFGDAANPPKLMLTDTGISVSGKNFEIAYLNTTNTPGAGWRQFLQINPGATGFYGHDCSADMLSTWAKVQADVWDIENVAIGKNLGGDGFYLCGSDGRLIGCSVAGMFKPNCEHPVRIDVLDQGSGKPGIRPSRILISKGKFISDPTVDLAKEAIAGRECDSLTIEDTEIGGWLRLGQESGESHVTNAVLNRLKFTMPWPKGQLADIMSGVTGIATGLEFGPFAGKQTFIRVNNRSQFSVADTILWQAAGGFPLVPGCLINADATATVSETNTIIRPVAA